MFALELGLICGSVYYIYQNSKNIKDIIVDSIYGKVEVKCANNLCNQKHKLSWSSDVVKNNMDFCCNMGCTMSAFNQ